MCETLCPFCLYFLLTFATIISFSFIKKKANTIFQRRKYVFFSNIKNKEENPKTHQYAVQF